MAVPLIVGRALKLSPEQVAMLIRADLFCCGLVTLIQALGATPLPGIGLPVMMGVTFASVAPMVAMANANPGTQGAGLIFGANISVLLGIVVAVLLATGLGLMNFDKVAKAAWFDVVLPFEIATPVFDPVLILTMSLVMIVVMIESTGMFLALSDMASPSTSVSCRPACGWTAWAR